MKDCRVRVIGNLQWSIFFKIVTRRKQLRQGKILSCIVLVIISYVTNYSLILARNFSFNCNFTCEITKLPWQRAVRLRFKMATKF